MSFATIWILIFLVALLVEFVALRRPKSGDTLSEQLWQLMCHTVWRVTLFAAGAWLAWHFFMEPFLPANLTTAIVDDLFVILVGGSVGYLMPPPKNRVDCDG